MMFSSISDRPLRRKNLSSPNMSLIYDLLVTSPDALPLSYRRLRPLNWVHVTNILHTARTGMSIGGIFAMTIKCDDDFKPGG